MDNLTHSLVGALLGQAGLKRKTGLAMSALVIGANIPDIDAACLLWLEGIEHVGFRRGITHGPPAMILLPLLLAGLLWGFDRWQAKRGKRPEGRVPVSFKWLFLLAFIGCLTHPALDWLNVYGVRLLEPFSSQWFYGDTLFIIDVWLWALMGFATWFSLRREKRGGEWMRPARTAIVVALGYIGLNGAISATSKEWTGWRGETVISSPVPILFWERELIVGSRDRWANGFVEPWDRYYTAPFDVEFCELDYDQLRARRDGQVDAFLFWSRAPFAERAEDGSVILRDARFYDPRVRDRFSVALPEVRCEELPAE
ncbi:MAG: metal-dependent hydrolase [Sphingomonadaceae bacterium]|nr:metal-dependent hydrolase [Sphingomonadaceae bacterium]MCP5383834.1 metal-dependent hydrolase [Altererythrobacter sp.]MCP5392171.1 metal-dependent hydrolase [Sphingomonadaceae bacterium]MCP5394279.1 metal-dependent hydrolase [Sphingomonadaceae bacterium]